MVEGVPRTRSPAQGMVHTQVQYPVLGHATRQPLRPLRLLVAAVVLVVLLRPCCCLTAVLVSVSMFCVNSPSLTNSRRPSLVRLEPWFGGHTTQRNE